MVEHCHHSTSGVPLQVGNRLQEATHAGRSAHQSSFIPPLSWEERDYTQLATHLKYVPEFLLLQTAVEGALLPFAQTPQGRRSLMTGYGDAFDALAASWRTTLFLQIYSNT